MTLTEEVEILADAEKYGITPIKDNPEKTKQLIEAFESSVSELEQRAEELGVAKSEIEKCNKSIPCLLKAIASRWSQIINEKFDELNKEQDNNRTMSL